MVTGYNYNLYSGASNSDTPIKSKSSGRSSMIPVRVVDVILDDTHVRMG